MLEKVLNRLQPSTSNEDATRPWGIGPCPNQKIIAGFSTKAQVIFEEAQQLVESMRFPKARSWGAESLAPRQPRGAEGGAQ